MLAAFAPRSWANTLRNSDSGSGLLLLLLEPELLPSQCGSDADGSGLLVQWWWGCSWGVAPLLCVFLTEKFGIPMFWLGPVFVKVWIRMGFKKGRIRSKHLDLG